MIVSSGDISKPDIDFEKSILGKEIIMKNNSNNESSEGRYIPIFMCLGCGVGVAIGAAFDNVGVGMCLGCGIGSLIGAVLTLCGKKGEK